MIVGRLTKQNEEPIGFEGYLSHFNILILCKVPLLFEHQSIAINFKYLSELRHKNEVFELKAVEANIP